MELTDEKLSNKAIKLRSKVRGNTEQTIKMYGESSEIVKLAFDRSLMSAVYDRASEKKKIMAAINGNKIMAKVQMQIIPTFWGWLFQFGNRMKVLDPKELREEILEKIKELLI